MPMSSANRFGLFLTAAPGGPLHSAIDLDAIARGLPGIPGLLHTHIYTPAAATDPYLDDGAPPPLMLECAFGTIEALEAALAGDAALPRLCGNAPLSQQAMLLRDFPVPNPPPAATCCTYVVTYEGEADDPNAWLSHYLAHHPPIMARFPAIRAIMVASRIDWCSGVAWPRETALQRNRVVFDHPAALDAALASPVRHEMRADFHTLPPFHGRNTHYAMNTRTIQGAPA